MKILLAVDGSDHSNAAVDAVAERPWPEDSVVEIICAIGLPVVAIPEAWAMPNTFYMQQGWAASEQAKLVVKDARHRLKAGRTAELETRAEAAMPNLECPDSTREAHTAHKVRKTWVRTERVEARSDQNAGVKPLFVPSFEPTHCLIRIPERCIDYGNFRSIRLARV